MKLFRKKPVTVEAMLYVGEENCREVMAWCGATRWHPERGISLRTLNGEVLAEPGDWITKDVAGTFYPCKPDVFAATHEPA